jgi:voltage-gated potassium channel
MNFTTHPTGAFERLLIFALFLVSATRFSIQKLMRGKTAAKCGDLIFRWNGCWLAWAIFVCATLAVVGIPAKTPEVVLWLVAVVVFMIPFWRCNEILIAFLFDAFDQMGTRRGHREPIWRKIIRGDSGHTDLSNVDRIKLALRSYVEVVLDVAMIHFGLSCLLPRLMPSHRDPFYSGAGISNIWDAIYFSGITITTVGYGDIAPAHSASRGFVLYEIGIGLVLLYVSIVVYLSRTPSASTVSKRQETKG